MGFSVDAFIWNLVSKKPCIIFAEESGGVALWVLVVLLLRTMLVLTKINDYVPQGFVFAFPLFVELLSKYVLLWRRNTPLLTVSLAESLLGRVSASRVVVLVPAHLLGAVFGVVLFKTLLPFIPNEVLAPFPVQSTWWLQTFLSEIALHFLFSVTLLVLPYLLSINRLSAKLASIPIALLFLLSRSSSFSPAMLYALWYVEHCTSALSGFGSLQIERLLGPLTGAVLAGLFCNAFFPDDPQSWTRKKKN